MEQTSKRPVSWVTYPKKYSIWERKIPQKIAIFTALGAGALGLSIKGGDYLVHRYSGEGGQTGGEAASQAFISGLNDEVNNLPKVITDDYCQDRGVARIDPLDSLFVKVLNQENYCPRADGHPVSKNEPNHILKS